MKKPLLDKLADLKCLCNAHETPVDIHDAVADIAGDVMDCDDGFKIISTNFLPWRFLAWFLYAAITLILIFALSFVLEAWIAVVIGVMFGTGLGAFNKFEPRFNLG